MRIARFEAADGRVLTGRLTDVQSAQPLVGELFGEHTFADDPVQVQRLLAPVAPVNIFAIGRNYKAHAAETGSQLPDKPMIFMKPTTAVIGMDDPIMLPASAPENVDYEAELVIVIGRKVRRVDPADALDYVLGFTCANDVSARDCQRDDKQWSRAKGFDTFCPLGPWIVTPDEFDPDARGIWSRVNGEVRQSANTSAMVFSCAHLVSYLSHQFTLLPGTIILTGTPEGVGMARNPPTFLKPGDVVEVGIEGIGTLRNRIGAAENA